MNLHRIESFSELLGFLPHLTRLHSELDGIWEPDLSKEEFTARVANTFNPNNYFFGEIAKQDLVYFVLLTKDTDDKCFFWLFYMNKEYRQFTKELLFELKQFTKDLGFKTCDFSTTRLTKSYDRWVRKFGAEPHTINYRLPL